MPDQPVVLYDGVCGFCNHAVQFLLRVDRRGELRFAALQSDFARGVIERHPELEGVDSLVYVNHPEAPDESVAVRSDGALHVISHADLPWRWLRVARVVPRPVRDRLYDGFAAIRYRVFGELDTCPLPSPEVRARFIDQGTSAAGA
jgi:predicted DCC family thiol-disulfide oxidoreductase YuxK